MTFKSKSAGVGSLNGSEGDLTLAYAHDALYANPAPVQTDGESTGISTNSIPIGTDVFVTCLFSINTSGLVYAITITIDNELAKLQPEIRQLRSAEPVTGVGDIALAAWVDGATGEYYYSLDIDGGGKTLESVSLITRTLTAV